MGLVALKICNAMCVCGTIHMWVYMCIYRIYTISIVYIPTWACDYKSMFNKEVNFHRFWLEVYTIPPQGMNLMSVCSRKPGLLRLS